MKRGLLICTIAMLGLAACSEQRTLTARKSEPAKDSAPNSEKPVDSNDNNVIGVVNMPQNANLRKMVANERAVRIIQIGAAGLQTTAFCTKNIISSTKEKERIKIQGQSHIMMRQMADIPNPDSNQNKQNAHPEELKNLVSFSCMAKSDALASDAKYTTVTKLETGKSVTIVGKFSSQSEAELSADVDCVSEKDMGEGDKNLLTTENDKRADILMAAGSKILVETSSNDKDLKKYILLTCDEAATP